MHMDYTCSLDRDKIRQLLFNCAHTLHVVSWYAYPTYLCSMSSSKPLANPAISLYKLVCCCILCILIKCITNFLKAQTIFLRG